MKEATAGFMLMALIIICSVVGFYIHFKVIDWRVQKAKVELLECLEKSLEPRDCL